MRPFILNIFSHWTDPAADLANMSWARRLFANLRPWMRPGVYVDFMSGDETERVAEAYEELHPLREMTKHDPQLDTAKPEHSAPVSPFALASR